MRIDLARLDLYKLYMRKCGISFILCALSLGALFGLTGCRIGSNTPKSLKPDYCYSSARAQLAVSSTEGLVSILQAPIPRTTDVKKLVQNDITALKNLNSAGPFALDRKFGSSFTNVFGGQQGGDVLRYLNERLHWLVGDGDALVVHPDQFTYNGWTSDPCADSNGISNQSAAREILFGDPNTQIGAANVSTQLWLQSVIDRVPVWVELNGKRIDIESMRVGLVKVGPAYKEFERDADGSLVVLPPPYRQQILIHEARHSDCTGGVTDQDLDVARNAKNEYDFYNNFTRRPCGHLHVYCPKGSPYAGVAACDRDPWGAYAVGAIYALAATRNYAEHEQSRHVMLMVAADAFSRLLYDGNDLLNGKLGTPDMSSAGLQH